MGCRHSTQRYEDPLPPNRPIHAYTHAYGEPSKPKPTNPKIHHVKSNPEMVNMRSADQVLRSPAQVTYPTSDYILCLTRKRKEEAAARAKAEAQARGDDGEEEDGGLEMAQTVPRSPSQAVYLSPEHFKTLTVKRAEEQTSAEGKGPPFRTTEYHPISTDDGNDTVVSKASSSHVPSTCPSPTARSHLPSEEGESEGTSYTDAPESSSESLRSYHTCK